MDIERREVVTQDPLTGTTEVSQHTQHIASRGEAQEAKAEKNNQVIWYIIGVINALLALRIVFRLLGANDTGFVSILYTVTSPFTVLFRGIFAEPSLNGSYFDIPAVLAIIILSLLGWGISSLINVTKRPVSVG